MINRSSPDRDRSLRKWPSKSLLILIYFVALSCWTISPVLLSFSSCLPIRNQQARTVPIFNAWTIWWNSDRLRNGLSDYWNAPIFFPEREAFAYSEPQPATMVVAPLVWLTRSPAVAYNVYLLMSLTLNGYVTFRVLRRLSCRWWLSLIGGSMVVWLPVSVREIEVLQLVPVWPIIWTWDSLRRYGIDCAPRVALEASVASVVCFYSCIHHTLFLALSIVFTAWPLLRSWPSLRGLVQASCACAIAIALIGIIYFPMRRSLKGEEFHRHEKLVQQLSASPESLIRLPRDSMLVHSKGPGKSFSPGWCKTFLAAVGLVLGLLRRRRRRWALFLGLTVIVCAVFANGPNLRFGDIEIWQLLGQKIPGIRQVRNVFRFVYFIQLAVIFLAVLAIQELNLYLCFRRRLLWVGRSLLGAFGIVALLEVPSPSVTLVGLPDLVKHHGWTDFVRTGTPVGKGIACLPFAPGLGVADFDDTVRWMYLSSLHGKPLVSGYSGFFPDESLKLNQLMTSEGLSQTMLSRLWSLNVHFLVVRKTDSIAGMAEMLPDGQYTLIRVFRDVVGVDVYELVPVPEPAQQPVVN